MSDVTSVNVEGTPATQTGHSALVQNPISPYQNNHQSPSPSSSILSTPRPIFSTKKTTSGATVKVTRATMKRCPNGKAEFSGENQTFISVSEANANVHFLQTVIQQKWGRNYVLVTSDGLPIEDSSGTQGLQYYSSLQ